MKKHALLDVIRGGRCTVLGYGVSNRPLVEWLLRQRRTDFSFVPDACSQYY